MFRRLVTCVFLAAVLSVSSSSRPKYIGCMDNKECAVGTCCMLGAGRFSIPQCTPLGEQDAPCRPVVDAPVYNTTLYYPDGQVVQVTNVYSIMCPCAHGLHCSKHERTCTDPYEEIKSNNLDGPF